TDHQLIVFKRDLELLAPEAGERQGNAQGFGACSSTVQGISRNPFDVVRRVAIAALANPIDQPFHVLKAQQERARQQGNARHGPSSKAANSLSTFRARFASHGIGPGWAPFMLTLANMGPAALESRNGWGTKTALSPPTAADLGRKPCYLAESTAKS